MFRMMSRMSEFCRVQTRRKSDELIVIGVFVYLLHITLKVIFIYEKNVVSAFFSFCIEGLANDDEYFLNNV